MNKDEVLELSREENRGRHDERELAIFGTASRVGVLVGALVCLAMVFVGELLLHIPEIGLVGWLVCFSMQGSSNIVLFSKLKKRRALAWGIVEIAIALGFGAMLVFKGVAQL